MATLAAMPDPTTTQLAASPSTEAEAATNKPARNASLLSYVSSPPEEDPFELELEAIREGRRRVDAGTLEEFFFKKAMEANLNSADEREKWCEMRRRRESLDGEN